MIEKLMQLTETQIDSETLFSGSFLSIHRDTVALPDQRHTQRVVVRHPGATCVLAETADKRLVLVRQWRYAVGGALLEVPAGKLEAGEDPAVCALRELAEETPYTAPSVRLLHTFYTAPGFCDEKMHLYLAENVQPDSTLNTDEDEFTETVLLDKAAVQAALAADEIADAKTLIALQHWLIHRA